VSGAPYLCPLAITPSEKDMMNDDGDLYPDLHGCADPNHADDADQVAIL